MKVGELVLIICGMVIFAPVLVLSDDLKKFHLLRATLYVFGAYFMLNWLWWMFWFQLVGAFQ